MLDTRRQFRVLYLSFLRRSIDLEVLSAQGDGNRLLIQFVALLGAFSLVYAINALPQYWLSTLSPRQLAMAGVGDQEFLIATTMAIVGIFATLSWGAVFPDRRDVQVLGLLPLRHRGIFFAKAAAIATGLMVSVVAVNAFTGLSYPFVAAAPGSGVWGGVRSLAAYWITMAAAGTFVFCTLLALQGTAALLLPYRVFLRASNFLQLAAFFVILGGYFITPGPADAPLAVASNQPLLLRLPSYWFLGLFQELNGAIDPVFGRFAHRACWAMLAAAVACCVFYPLAFRGQFRRIVEQPDVVPANRSGPAARVFASAAYRLFRKSIERAVVLFTARTLTRSRPHRVMLAVYAGLGLAVSLAYVRGILYKSALPGDPPESWRIPGVSLTAIGFVMLFSILVGARAIFAYPVTLKANWIFRITAVHSPGAYFASIRKAMLLLGAAPVWLALGALYFSLWPAGWAALYLLLMLAAGMILLPRLLIGFRKVPFTCSYLPGKSDMKIKLGAYGIAFLTVTHVAAMFSNGMLETPARTMALGIILGAVTIRAQRRWAEFASSPYQELQFEDREEPEVMPLSFHRDGAFGMNLHYADDVAVEYKRPLRSRFLAALKLTAATLGILAAIGAVYERVNEKRDRIRYPQIGRSYDIGGRSLNLYCSGSGSPAVIFEGTQSTPGYAWAAIQRSAARFTQACWYDRAGYGWSDPGPFPNHADSIAQDLHRLLDAAGVAPPYLLVGHALGGFSTRVFAGYYTSEMAGLVLLDPFNEDTTIQVHNHIEAFRPAVVWFARAMGHLGWWRLIAGEPGPPPTGFSAEQWAVVFAMRGQAKTVAARIGEPPLWVNGELARAVRPSLRNLPLTVLSGEQHDEFFECEDTELELVRHARLAGESVRGTHQVIAGSGYWNPLNTPDVVVEAARRMVEEARREETVRPLDTRVTNYRR